MVATLLGQLVRSKAMIDAGAAFTHEIAHEHVSSHKLIRTGLYAYLPDREGAHLLTHGDDRYVRHPSYAGFFLWALGTQMILGNGLCLAGYGWVLFRFFRERIQEEEKYLVDFFPAEYEKYRRICNSGFPCIP